MMILLLLILTWGAATTVYVFGAYCLDMPREAYPDGNGLHIPLTYYDRLHKISTDELFYTDIVLYEQRQIAHLQGRETEAESQYLKDLDKFQEGAIIRLLSPIVCLLGVGRFIVSITQYSWWVYALMFSSCLIPIVLFERTINKRRRFTDTLFLDLDAVSLCEDICERECKASQVLAYKADADPNCDFDYKEFHKIQTDFLNARIALIGLYSKLLSYKKAVAYILMALSAISFVRFFIWL